MQAYFIIASLLFTTLAYSTESKIVEITSNNTDFYIRMQTTAEPESHWEEIEVNDTCYRTETTTTPRTCESVESYEVPDICEKIESYTVPATCYRDEEDTISGTCYRLETNTECNKKKLTNCERKCIIFSWACRRVCYKVKNNCEEITRNISYDCEHTRTRNVAYSCEKIESRVVKKECTKTAYRNTQYNCPQTQSRQVPYSCTRVERREISPREAITYNHFIYFQVNSNNRKDLREKVEVEVIGKDISVKQVDKLQHDLKILPISSREEVFNNRIIINHDVIISI